MTLDTFFMDISERVELAKDSYLRSNLRKSYKLEETGNCCHSFHFEFDFFAGHPRTR